MSGNSDSDFDAASVSIKIDQWKRRAGRVNAEAVAQILEDANGRSVLRRVFGHAPYLAKCSLAHPDAVIEALSGRPEKIISEVERDLKALDRAAGPSTALTRAVRPCKERAAVAIGFADLAGLWSAEQVGEALSKLGERTLDASLSWLTRMAYRNGDVILQSDSPTFPLPGLFILGGGDFTSNEPSYCGPLEIAVIYDQNALAANGVEVSKSTIEKIAGGLKDAFRASRDAPAIFELALQGAVSPTSEGDTAHFVISTDELLDSIAGANAAFRSWFANARVVAGDQTSGSAFVDAISGKFWSAGVTADFVRKAVSPEAEATASTKQDDIWRLVQTCRLALGGKLAEIRNGSARTVFEAAHETGAIDQLTSDRLTGNADFVRTARNRLQLVLGRAVSAPQSPDEEIARATLVGYTETKLFDAVFEGCQSEAKQQWLNIVSPPAETARSNAALKGDESTTAKLEEIGFADGQDVSAIVDNWVSGRHGDKDIENQRRRLSEIAPGLLTEFARTQNPDRAIDLFDQALGRLPNGSDPFESLNNDPFLADAIVDFLGNTPAYAQIAIEDAETIREILCGQLKAPENIAQWIERYAPPVSTTGIDDKFVRNIHNWLEINKARLCYFTVAKQIDAESYGVFLTAITEAAVKTIYKAVVGQTDKAQEPGKGIAIVALGDFGGSSLKAGDPIDIAFVYDAAGESGATPEAVEYYSNVASQITEAVQQPATPEGKPLFVIDARQRPGGAGGDIATSVQVYLNFYTKEAHPEEHLALTRARIICGPDGLRDRLEAAVTECVTRPRKAERLMIDADKAHAKVQKQNKPESLWDVDRIRGGIADLDFVAEVLQVRFGAENPYVMAHATPDAFAALGRAGCLDPDTATDLIESHLFWSRLRTVLCIADISDFETERPRQRLGALISEMAGVSDFGSVEPLIQGHAERVTAHYRRLILGDENASPANSIVAA